MEKSINLIIEIPLQSVQSDKYDANIERYGDHSDTCIICGKLLKGEYRSVQMLTNGNLISTDQECENSQGFFPVGKDCAKRLVIHFTFAG